MSSEPVDLEHARRIAGDVRQRDRDATARIDPGVENLDAEEQARHRRPDGVRPDAVLVKIDEARDRSSDARREGRRGGRHEIACGRRCVEPHPRAEHVRLPGGGPVVVDAAGDAVGGVGLEVARERVHEGVGERKPERPGADGAVAAGRCADGARLAGIDVADRPVRVGRRYPGGVAGARNGRFA